MHFLQRNADAASTLQHIIRRLYAWDVIDEICTHRPYLIQNIVFSNGNTALHEICNIGSAPYALIAKVLNVWKEALAVRNKYGDTPLHITTRNSQKSLNRVKLIVEACLDLDVKLQEDREGEQHSLSLLEYQNMSGQTPLATACVSIAWFPVLTLLIEKCPKALTIKDCHGHTPAEAMWGSFQKNIIGVTSIRQFLRSNDDTLIKGGVNSMSPLLQRFWDKFCFCVLESFEYDRRRQGLTDEELQAWLSVRDKMLIHAILSEGIHQGLDALLELALKNNPSLGMHADQNGNTPLHILACREKSTKNNHLISILISKCRASAKEVNNQGRLPLHIAMDNYWNLDNAIDYGVWQSTKIRTIMVANVDALECFDTICSENNEKVFLYPFMTAAWHGDLETTFEMIKLRPNALFHSMK